MKVYLMAKITRATSLITIALLFSIAAFGQSNTGSITGVVSDPNGAVIANATVTSINQATNERRTVQSDGELGSVEMTRHVVPPQLDGCRVRSGHRTSLTAVP